MDEITRIAHRLQEADGVVAVALGGSGARGTHRPDSDVDLGLYYRAPLDTEALRRLASELSGDTVEVTEPGGWGPWVNGGAWLTVESTPVDWIYRDLDHVRRVTEELHLRVVVNGALFDVDHDRVQLGPDWWRDH